MFTFARHEIRRVTDLSGNWQFTFLGGGDPDKICINRIRFNDWMTVPMAFDAVPPYAGKRGLAAYRISLQIPPNQLARLHFGAVSMWCRVFIDGEAIGEHTNGYTPFCLTIPASAKSQRALTVLVDNQFNFDRSPLQEDYFDWYHHGGIIRPVALHLVPETFIDRIGVTVTDWSKGSISIDVMLGGIPGDREKVTAYVDGKQVTSRKLAIRDGRASFDLSVPNSTPWSPDAPSLHYLRIALSEDDLCVRFGLRDLRISGDEVLLNRRPLKLLGYCRHEAHPQFGPALPEAQMLADLALLKDLGCNFVRGSHYPQDQRFLDLCDEVGMLVWEEALGWQQEKRHFTDERYMQLQEDGCTEMVEASFNHPSVIMWGVLNEGHSDIPEGRIAYERLIRHIRALDPTRPVTFGSCKGPDDICQDLVDIAGFNIYPGWYSESPDDIVPTIRKHLQIARKNGPKPFIVSEIGAGAIYGCRDDFASRWSEQYQACVLEKVAKEIIRNRKITGTSLWQFCDCRTSLNTHRVLDRPRAFNNKGTLDEYRRPKLAYEVVKKLFTK